MIKRNSYILHAAIAMLALASCGGGGEQRNNNPIVMGDTSTIVTETDPQYTKDLVADLHPNIPTKTHNDEDDDKAATPDTTVQKSQPAQAAVAPGNGLNIAFKDLSVSIPGITVKSYRTQDPLKSNGVSYQLVSGNISTSRIVINSGTVLKVSLRYQSELVANGQGADLPLDNLTTTSDWAPIPGNKNVYPSAGLEPAKLEAPEFTPTSLRNAITRAARRHRMGRQREQELQAAVRNVRKAGQKPLSIGLRSVMWKIDGKDAAGHQFSKQIRVDVP